MDSVNKVVLLGVVEKTASNNTMTKVIVSTTHKWVDKQGNEKSETNKVPVLIYPATNSITDGETLHIIGKLETRTTEKDGVKKFTTYVISDSLLNLGKTTLKAGINSVMILGNVTKDPDNKTSGNGTAISNFSVVSNRSVKDASGTRKDVPEFHNATALGGLSENVVAKYVKKGNKVYIEGRFQVSEYEKDGVMKESSKVFVENIVLLPNGGNDSMFTDFAES